MALIYYPQSSYVSERNTESGSMVVLSLNVSPNNIFFFNTASELSALSQSVTDAISASYAKTSSFTLTTITSASYVTGSVNGITYTLGGDYYTEYTNNRSTQTLLAT